MIPNRFLYIFLWFLRGNEYVKINLYKHSEYVSKKDYVEKKAGHTQLVKN